ncbi:MAG: Gfo/Idh/MocA family oxidoreductase [Bacteroidetes bacterium]|nr:Gfo/Idh/MocA family oxidoreductase [Bacteroidota bacterium]
MQKPIKFGLIGAAGYIAPRHMKAIKETDNELVAALDKFDSVGIIDSYFPNAAFFLEAERFDRHLDKLRRQGENKIEYVSICSPNYLHDSHIRLALRNDAHAICEKPLVLNPWNIDALEILEKQTGKKIYNILQLRLHPSIIDLKKRIDEDTSGKIYDVNLAYITSRGSWYQYSWKGDNAKSGGIATNIGVHFFDMLIWIFGGIKENIIHKYETEKAGGYLELEKARVRWFLSIDYNDIPEEIKVTGQRTYRSISVENQEIKFSGGFTDLHTQSYQHILNGNGFGLSEACNSIQIVHDIRHKEVVGLVGDYHPFLKK